MKKLYTFVFMVGMACFANAQTVTITADKDNTIYSENNNSNGAGQEIFAGVNSLGSKRRALIHYNLSTIPTGAVINSVTITLINSSNATHAGGLNLYKLTKNWGEGTSDPSGSEGQGVAATTGDATWTNAVHPSTPWTTAGGDFSALSASISTVPASTVSISGGTLAADVQSFVSNPASNFGWIITGNNEAISTTAFSFFSRNNTSNQPTITITYSPRLPITLRSFSGSLQNGEVLLEWKTASEINNQYFDIERSANGINFSAIGRVRGNGTSSAEHSYTFIDNHLTSGNHYYRLAQHDFDGNVHYSSIILLSNKSNTSLSVTPNPAASFINVAGSASLEGSAYVITSSGGQTVKKGIITKQQINVQELPPGQYWLSIQKAHETLTGASFIKR